VAIVGREAAHWEYPDSSIHTFHLAPGVNAEIMVNTKGQNIGLWWVGGHRYENNVIENNIFHVARSQDFSAPGLVFGRHNLYCGRKVDPKHTPEMMHHKGSPLASMDPIDFTLRADGPAVDAGVAGKDYHHQNRGRAPDLGAIELGDTFEFPAPGPRWAKEGEAGWQPWKSATNACSAWSGMLTTRVVEAGVPRN